MVYLSDIMQKRIKGWVAGIVILLLVIVVVWAIAGQAAGQRKSGRTLSPFLRGQTQVVKPSLRPVTITPPSLYPVTIAGIITFVAPSCGRSCQGGEPCRCLICNCWCLEVPPPFPWGEVQTFGYEGATSMDICPLIFYTPFPPPFAPGRYILGGAKSLYPKFFGIDSFIGTGTKK